VGDPSLDVTVKNKTDGAGIAKDEVQARLYISGITGQLSVVVQQGAAAPAHSDTIEAYVSLRIWRLLYAEGTYTYTNVGGGHP